MQRPACSTLHAAPQLPVTTLLACDEAHAVLVIPREVHKGGQDVFPDVLRLQCLTKGCQRLRGE